MQQLCQNRFLIKRAVFVWGVFRNASFARLAFYQGSKVSTVIMCDNKKRKSAWTSNKC